MRAEDILRFVLLQGWKEVRGNDAAPSLITCDNQSPRLILI